MQETIHPLKSKKAPQITLCVVAAVLIAALSFIAGMQMRKESSSIGSTTGLNQASGTMDNTQLRQGRPNGSMRIMGGAIGEVTSVTATNITITARTGGSTVFSINSSTSVTKDGKTASMSDVANGNTVMITKNNEDATVADNIAISPETATSFDPSEGDAI